MHWEKYPPDLLKHAARIPGGTALIDHLLNLLEIQDGQHLLDLSPGDGLVSAVVAREHDVKITALASDAEMEAASESMIGHMGVSDRVSVIPGTPVAIPLPAEEFHRVFYIAHPFPIPATPGVIAEVHRMLGPDALIGMAGPASMTNRPPEYMTNALREIEGGSFRTPAFTALLYAQQGLHVVRAEYLPEAYDHWRQWLEKAPKNGVPDTFRRAVIEDAGRWLSLGVIILRKPPRPTWAV